MQIHVADIPVEHADGWCVLRLEYGGGCWFPLMWTVARTRADAIAQCDRVGGEPYAKARRRGEMKAVRCTITASEV
jgi:uncharacterized membrane protein